jgi:hypothetical protein
MKSKVQRYTQTHTNSIRVNQRHQDTFSVRRKTPPLSLFHGRILFIFEREKESLSWSLCHGLHFFLSNRSRSIGFRAHCIVSKKTSWKLHPVSHVPPPPFEPFHRVLFLLTFAHSRSVINNEGSDFFFVGHDDWNLFGLLYYF